MKGASRVGEEPDPIKPDPSFLVANTATGGRGSVSAGRKNIHLDVYVGQR